MVEVAFIINSDGKVYQAKTSRTTNPAFNQAAEAAVLKWRFKPGLKDGKPVATAARQVVEFSVDVLPVYPFALAQAEIEGSATVEFSRDENGRPFDITIIAASRPEFGRALQAAITASTYAPSFDGGHVAVKGLRTTMGFTPTGRKSLLDAASRKILARLKTKENIPDESGLDQPLEAKVAPEPRLPQNLAADQQVGFAIIQAFVDEDGSVKLPSVDSTTNEELGYSAAQAVAGWKYAPPHIRGKSSLVRVKIRVDFKPKN